MILPKDLIVGKTYKVNSTARINAVFTRRHEKTQKLGNFKENIELKRGAKFKVIKQNKYSVRIEVDKLDVDAPDFVVRLPFDHELNGRLMNADPVTDKASS
jgi:hypothetical protein